LPSEGDNKTVVKTEPLVQEVTTDVMSTIKIGDDVEYPILGAKKRALSNSAEQVLYNNTKDERKNLSTDEITVLFKSAMQLAHKKYDVLPLLLKDEDKL
jgi:hypothetical protein